MKKITLTLAAIAAAITMNAQTTIWEDGFETYNDYETTSIGGWTQIDNDGDSTYGSDAATWTNINYVGTGMVFNPANTTPSLANGIWDPYTGNKGLYFFAATGDNSGTPVNDDYMISPLIDLTNATDSQLSFWAKSLTDTYGLEKFEVLLSVTGTAEQDFTINLSNGVVEPPIDVYTEYIYDLSNYDGQQVYFAIHYVTQDAFVLQMDDFKVVEDALKVNDQNFEGFNHYVANNVLTLKANTTISNARLYNILGQEVISKNLGTQSADINLNSLNSGVYLVQVEIEGQSKSFKIVKK